MAPGPAPLDAFVAELRHLQRESGQPSIRDLVVLMRAAGTPYPKSTISDKLAGVSKPTWEFVAAFVRACARHRGEGGVSDAEFARWRRRFQDLRRGLAASEAVTPGGGVPRQLPPAVAGFTGRTTEIAALDAMLDDSFRAEGTLGIALLSGTAGAGKTALAVHWAHRVAGRFADGQLYVDLRGYDPDAPTSAEQALDGFLRTLDRSAPPPVTLADKTARYRSLLAGRNVLVVLDNAYAVDQVRPLLPGDAGCLVVVTSRDRLSGLVTRNGARRIGIARLAEADATTLLRELVGRRADVDPVATARLAVRCARLPLTLRIAAEHLAARPDLSVSELVESLAGERPLLDAFDDETDERADVRAVLSWSYRHLPPGAARLFRYLAAHPAGPVGEVTMWALADADQPEARRAIDALASEHLIEPAGSGRWQMHDLLRAYAADRFAEDPEAERAVVRARLLDFFVAAVAAAMDRAFPDERGARPEVAHKPAVTVPLTDADAAMRWLDAERAALVECVDIAVRYGLDDAATILAGLLWRYLDNGVHVADALRMHRHTLDLARAAGDRQAEARVRTRMGVAYWRTGRHHDALRELTEALEAGRHGSDPAGDGGVHNMLGLLHTSLGSYPQAIGHLTDALVIARRDDIVVGEVATLDNLGRTHRLWGRLDQAAAYGAEALAVSRAAGLTINLGKILANLAATELLQGRLESAKAHATAAGEAARAEGDVVGAAMASEVVGWWQVRSGRPDDALATFGELLDLQQGLGDRDGRPGTRTGFAAAYLLAGRPIEAADQLTRALRTAQAIGDPAAQCASYNGLGRAALAADDPAAAATHFTAALTLSSTIDEWYERAEALRGLAEAHRAAGDDEAADSTGAEALTWYERAGAAAPTHGSFPGC